MLQSLRRLADSAERLGSPFSAGLLSRLAEDAAAGGPTVALLAPWAGAPEDVVRDDLPGLRLTAALHDLALSGEDPELAATYPRPDRASDAEAAWGPVRAALAREAGRIAEFMTHEPQTNEVGRAAMLLGGFLETAARTGLPLRCFEIAASAGLNLSWDRYRYRLGDLRWGDPQSPVVLEPDWSGPSPPDAPARVIERAACDRRPIDLSNPAEARRLMAYVWPDQFERLARLKAAIDVTRAAGVAVEEADAADWVRARCAPKVGAATVVYHSVFWHYVPAEGQAALRGAIVAHAQSATEASPFAWLRMESQSTGSPMEIRLTLWPGGEEHLLGQVHAHGADARWGEAALTPR